MRRQGGSLRLLPLSGHRHEDAHRSAFRFAKGLRSLYRKILNEKIRHAGFEIIEQRLQERLDRFPDFRSGRQILPQTVDPANRSGTTAHCRPPS